MEITITIEGTNGSRLLNVSDTATPFEVLKELGFHPDEVLVISKTTSEKPVPIDTKLKPGEKLVIIPVASGG